MFRSLFLFRRLLATTFLAVFVNVFVGQCYCAGMTPPKAASALKQEPAAKPLPMKPGHACCKAGGKQKPAASERSSLSPQQKQSDQGNCCKDKSTKLLSTLAAPVEKQLVATSPALLPEATAFHFRPAAGQWDRTSAVVLVLREHLPPKIPDIRIFIQSLTV
ncbi:hypothetical protein I2I05_14710 [Hymenobacter sp. BT683]|uniref:Uncharacterized protein n=1 Tax=Hymenobacter jeongseonensis TaxID=2791027 RepID=A0ABS0IJU3_9BACT|nr:hypothetical protein [Hymenobacter jeongseonensis]MBF9238653.1 hypothetical protein [Hymenobacter jeongseonensis]